MYGELWLIKHACFVGTGTHITIVYINYNIR
jgi:hypothetical protein